MNRNLVITGAQLLGGADIAIEDGVIVEIGAGLTRSGARVIDAAGLVALPGLVDLHTHLREPGFEASETVLTGTQAAAAGGFTAVFAMPSAVPARSVPASVASSVYATPCHADTQTPARISIAASKTGQWTAPSAVAIPSTTNDAHATIVDTRRYVRRLRCRSVWRPLQTRIAIAPIWSVAIVVLIAVRPKCAATAPMRPAR